MPDPRQLFLLLVALLVPSFLIVTNRERLLLAWICFVVSINIFDTNLLVNLPAARLAGLLLIPQTIRILPDVTRIRPGKALVLQFLYLALLGLIFGFLFPWSDGGFQRSFNQSAPGRTIIYLIRTVADLSLVFFVARQIVKSKRPDAVVRYILVGTSVAAMAGIAEWLTRIDLYGLITGLRSLDLEFRMRGFNYEPRGLGLIATHGVLLSLLLYTYQRSWKRFALIALHMLALFLGGSTSALVCLILGGVTLFLVNRRVRPAMLVSAIAGGLILLILVAIQLPWLTNYQDNVQLRLAGDIGLEPRNLVEDLAFRMGVFDGSAFLFLASNPIYAILGTGPGLISLPATAYMPESIAFDWLVQSGSGINNPPTTGALLELSNTGIIGLLLWAFFWLFSLRAFNYHMKQSAQPYESWAIGKSAFVVATAIYLAQASVLSAIWPVFMGSGLACSYLAAAERRLSVVAFKPGVRSVHLSLGE